MLRAGINGTLPANPVKIGLTEDGSFPIQSSDEEKEVFMPPLRIGIIGAQFAAHLHLNNYKSLRGVKVEIPAVACRTKGSAGALAKEFGIPEAVDDYRRLRDRRGIDAVAG